MSIYIVKTGDGFAIRKDGFFGMSSYKDLKSRVYWWQKSSRYFDDCVGSLEEVEERLKWLRPYEIVRRVH